MSVDLSVDLGGLKMKNPVTVGSGTFAYGQEYDAYFDVQMALASDDAHEAQMSAERVSKRVTDVDMGAFTPAGHKTWMRLSLVIQEAADELGVTASTLRRWLQDGRVHGQKVGRQWRFQKEWIDEWVNQNTTSLQEEAG